MFLYFNVLISIFVLIFFPCVHNLQEWEISFPGIKDTEHDFQNYQFRQISKNELLDIDDNGLMEVSCSNGNANNIDKHKSAQCQVRKRVVPLKAPITMSKLIYLQPSHVEVSWCSGYCDYYPHSSMSCMPTKLQTTEIAVTAVMLTKPTKTEAKCFLAKVQEHVACTCNCSIQPEHCQPIKQIYNKSRCRCECKDTKQQVTCEKSGRIWDPVTCSCECLATMQCTTGSLFDPVNCMCAKVMKIKVNKKDPTAWKSRLKVNKKKKEKTPKLMNKRGF